MAGILSRLAPFEPVTIKVARDFRLSVVTILEENLFFEMGCISSFQYHDAEFPLRNTSISIEFLLLNNTISPVELPLGYLDNSIKSIQSYFEPLDSVTPPNIPNLMQKYPALEDVYFSPLDLSGVTALDRMQEPPTLENVDFFPLSGIGEDTQNIFLENKLEAVNSFQDALNLLPPCDLTQISANLLKILMGPERVSGMLYADRYWKTVKVTEEKKIKGKKSRPLNSLNPIDLHTINGIPLPKPKFSPTFWDLVFILLQPPLDFNKQQNALLPFPLYQYQIPGVEFLYSNEHALLADDMGTGKTVMTLVALKLLFGQNKIKHAMILCPPTVLYEWKKHIALWTPEIIPIFVRGTLEIRKLEWNMQAHIYLTSYDTVRSDIENQVIPKEKLNFFDIVIVDEAHHIKNPMTSRSKAIRKLNPKRRWALTGTPIQNKLEDLIALYDFIYPGFLKPFDYIPYRIMEKIKPHFLRRRKQDVLKDLPPKLNQDIWLEMSDEQAHEYELAEMGIIRELEGMGEKLTKQHIFAKIQLLKRICNFPSNKTTSPKIDFIKEQIEEITSSNNKVIIFSQYLDDGVKKIELALSPFGTAKIVGGLSDSARQIEIEKFKTGNKHPVLVASVRSAGEGLNLTEASYVIHFDHWWNPAVKWQAEDRAHRKGQTQPVNVYSYWMEDTIDRRIYDILREKGLLISNVVDGLAAPKSEDQIDELFSMADLKKMLGLKATQSAKAEIDLSRIVKLDPDGIKQFLQDCTPKEFEDLVGHLMHYLGYPNVRTVGKAHDGGIDVESSRNTGQGIDKIVAQCKHYRKPVGVQTVRDFFGAIKDNSTISKGYLVTTSEFTSECINFCIRNDISMIDGIKMAEYVKKFGLSPKRMGNRIPSQFYMITESWIFEKSEWKQEMNKMDMCWVATAKLIYPHTEPSFMINKDQIETEVLILFGVQITLIMVSGHLVSWEDRQADKEFPKRGGSRNRYLFRTDDGQKPSPTGSIRLYKQVDSVYDGIDKNGKTHPDREKVLSEYHYLLEWYETVYFAQLIG